MSWALRFDGLEEFKADLRRLPEELAEEGGAIVENHAEEAAAAIKQSYPRVTGNLREGMEVEHFHTPFGTTSVVRNRAPHAFIFENGTEARHYFTDGGVKKEVGRMPPGHVFVPIIIRYRRRMNDALKALMTDKGLEVLDDAA